MDENSDFHPCNTPRGTLYYKLGTLTDVQQEKLNDLKVNVARENYKYLAAHPEIRAVIQLILRNVLTRRPLYGITEFIAKIFTLPDADLEEIINNYIKENNLERKPSIVTVTSSAGETSGSSEIFNDEDTDENAKTLLSEASLISSNRSVRSKLQEIQDELIIDYLNTLYRGEQLDEKANNCNEIK